MVGAGNHRASSLDLKWVLRQSATDGGLRILANTTALGLVYLQHCLAGKQKPRVSYDTRGFLNLVAGVGFEPTTFGL